MSSQVWELRCLGLFWHGWKEMVWWSSLNYYLSGLHILHFRIFALKSSVQMAVLKFWIFHFKTKQIKKNFGKVQSITKHLEVFTPSFFLWIYKSHSFAEIFRISAWKLSPWIVVRCYAKLMEQGKAWRGDMGSSGKVWRWRVIWNGEGLSQTYTYINMIYNLHKYETTIKTSINISNIWSIFWEPCSFSRNLDYVEAVLLQSLTAEAAQRDGKPWPWETWIVISNDKDFCILILYIAYSHIFTDLTV